MAVCAIIGAGSGIGLSVAKRFAREGFAVALCARRADALERLAAEVPGARTYVCDAERDTAIVDALRHIGHDLGAVDVLVYNAAAIRRGGPLEVSAEQMVRELRVNVAGALVAAQQVVPDMKARHSGTILFTGGGLALDPWPAMTSLAVGKAALRSLAISLHKELSPAGIHVATVTVSGIVERGTKFDPDRIADAYWELHSQPAGAFEAERIIK